MFKKIHRELKKESCRKIGNGFLVMALILLSDVCLVSGDICSDYKC